MAQRSKKTSVPISSPDFSAWKAPSKKYPKPITITVFLATLSLFLVAAVVLVDGNDFLAETRAMSLFPTPMDSCDPSEVSYSPSDLQSLPLSQNVRMPILEQDSCFITAKVQDKDTGEPILSVDAYLHLNQGENTREYDSLPANMKQCAEGMDPGLEEAVNNEEIDVMEIVDAEDKGDDKVFHEPVCEESDAYKVHKSPNGEGMVLFEVPDRFSGSGYVTMNAPGYKTKTLSFSVAGGEHLNMGVVCLEVKWRVYGRVTDLDGNPIEGTEVLGTCSRSCFRKGELIKESIEHPTITDAEGSFSFSSKDDGHDRWYPQTIRAKASGYETRIVDKVDERTMPIVISLDEGKEIRGTVVWSLDKSPIAGARLICPERRYGWAALPEIMTDEKGRFMFPGFPACDGTLAINIRHPRQLPDRVIAVPKLKSDLGEIVVEGPVTVGVTVTDRATGLPVPKATVFSGPIGFNFKTQRTDDYGSTNITGIPSGKKFDVSACAPGYYSERNNYKKIITGAPGSYHDLKLTLEKKPVTAHAFLVHGRVIDWNDNPVSDAEITLYSEDRGNYELGKRPAPGVYHLSSSEMTDESGSFEIHMNDHRWIETVVVEHPRYAPFRSDGTPLNGTTDREISITMDEITEWFYGMVCTDEKIPVPGASVEIEYGYLEGSDCGLGHRFDYRAKTDGSGLFSLPFFPGMSFKIKAWKEKENSKALTGLSEETLVPGANCVELALPVKDDFSINFECRRASGRALVDFRIDADDVRSRVTDYRGNACCDNLDGRTYQFSIHDPNCTIGMYGYGLNPLHIREGNYRIELIPGRFVEVGAMMCLDDKALEWQAGTVNLIFEEQKGDAWEKAAITIPDVNDASIRWNRRIEKGDVYVDATTGNPVISFVTYLYEGTFRVKLSAKGFQEVLSDPFTVSEQSETLQMHFDMRPL